MQLVGQAPGVTAADFLLKLLVKQQAQSSFCFKAVIVTISSRLEGILVFIC